MNGTVLNIVDGAGILLDDQGNRYSFGQGAVQGGAIRNGSKVNFIVEGNQAKEIYGMSGGSSFTGSSDFFGSMSQKIDELTGGSEIKKTAYIAALGIFISIIGVAFNFLVVIGFALELYAVYRLAVLANDMSFFWYQIKTIGAVIIAILLILYGFSMVFESAWTSGFFIVLGLVAFVYSIFTTVKAFTGIGRAYDVNLFYLVAKLYIAIPVVLTIFALVSIASELDNGWAGILLAWKNLAALSVVGSLLWVGWAGLLIASYLKIRDVSMVGVPQSPPKPQSQPQTTAPTKNEETVMCTQCNSVNLKTAKFCTNCGGLLVKEVVIVEPKCSVCGKVYSDGSKFCEEDGGKIV